MQSYGSRASSILSWFCRAAAASRLALAPAPPPPLAPAPAPAPAPAQEPQSRPRVVSAWVACHARGTARRTVTDETRAQRAALALCCGYLVLFDKSFKFFVPLKPSKTVFGQGFGGSTSTAVVHYRLWVAKDRAASCTCEESQGFSDWPRQRAIELCETTQCTKREARSVIGCAVQGPICTPTDLSTQLERKAARTHAGQSPSSQSCRHYQGTSVVQELTGQMLLPSM